MLGSAHQRLRDEGDLNICKNGKLLSDFNEAPYPVLLLNSDLSWANSILNLCNKLSRAVAKGRLQRQLGIAWICYSIPCNKGEK